VGVPLIDAALLPLLRRDKAPSVLLTSAAYTVDAPNTAASSREASGADAAGDCTGTRPARGGFTGVASVVFFFSFFLELFSIINQTTLQVGQTLTTCSCVMRQCSLSSGCFTVSNSNKRNRKFERTDNDYNNNKANGGDD